MSEQDMVARVATVLYKHAGPNHSWQDIARAAIEAMREPSDVMVLVGTREIISESPQTDCREAWRAMIDKALGK